MRWFYYCHYYKKLQIKNTASEFRYSSCSYHPLLGENFAGSVLEWLTRRWKWTGQSRAAFERQYLTDSFYLYHSLSVIVAQPLSLVVPGGCAAWNRGADYVQHLVPTLRA